MYKVSFFHFIRLFLFSSRTKNSSILPNAYYPQSSLTARKKEAGRKRASPYSLCLDCGPYSSNYPTSLKAAQTYLILEAQHLATSFFLLMLFLTPPPSSALHFALFFSLFLALRAELRSHIYPPLLPCYSSVKSLFSFFSNQIPFPTFTPHKKRQISTKCFRERVREREGSKKGRWV